MVDTISAAQAQQAPVEPFVIGHFVLLHALLQAVGRHILFVVAPAHEQQACARQGGRNGQVSATDAVCAPGCFKVECVFIVNIDKGKLCCFYGFTDVKFLAKNAGQFAAVLLCPFHLLRQVVGSCAEMESAWFTTSGFLDHGAAERVIAAARGR